MDISELSSVSTTAQPLPSIIANGIAALAFSDC